MLSEFRDFIARGNVLDLAVAVIIGAAFATESVGWARPWQVGLLLVVAVASTSSTIAERVSRWLDGSAR